MSEAEAPPRAGITVRLDPAPRDRVQRIAAFEHRSINGSVPILIERDLQTRDEAERVMHVRVAPELADELPGPLLREEGEVTSVTLSALKRCGSCWAVDNCSAL